MTTNRVKWVDYFLKMADLAATRSTCIRRHVGAVLVKDHRILATGYNGAPSGHYHCTVESCLRLINGVPSGTRHEMCRGVHAEANCIIQAARFGFSVEGSKLYCTHYPCSMCAKMIVGVGIREVVYRHYYPDPMTYEIFNYSAIPCIQIKTPCTFRDDECTGHCHNSEDMT